MTEVKKWGNSVGILIPKQAVKRLELKIGEKISADIQRKEKIDGFGIFKGAKSFKEEDLIEKW